MSEDNNRPHGKRGQNNKGKKWGTQWKPGESGNPNGRPKYEVYKNGEKLGPEGTKKYLDRHSKRAAQRLVKLLDSADESVQMSAVKEVLNRTMGKPDSNVKISGQVEHTYADLLLQVKNEIQGDYVDVTPKQDAINHRGNKE